MFAQLIISLQNQFVSLKNSLDISPGSFLFSFSIFSINLKKCINLEVSFTICLFLWINKRKAFGLQFNFLFSSHKHFCHYIHTYIHTHTHTYIYYFNHKLCSWVSQLHGPDLCLGNSVFKTISIEADSTACKMGLTRAYSALQGALATLLGSAIFYSFLTPSAIGSQWAFSLFQSLFLQGDTSPCCSYLFNATYVCSCITPTKVPVGPLWLSLTRDFYFSTQELPVVPPTFLFWFIPARPWIFSSYCFHLNIIKLAFCFSVTSYSAP